MLTPQEEEELKRLSNWQPTSQPTYERPLVSLTNQAGTAAPGYNPVSATAPTGRQWTPEVNPTSQATGQRGYDPRFDDPDYGKPEKEKQRSQWGRVAERPRDPYLPTREPGYYDPTHGGTDQYGRAYQQTEQRRDDDGPGFWGRMWDASRGWWNGEGQTDEVIDAARQYGAASNSTKQIAQAYDDYLGKIEAANQERDAAALLGPSEDAWTPGQVWDWTSGKVSDWWNSRESTPIEGAENMHTVGAPGAFAVYAAPIVDDVLRNPQVAEYNRQGREERRKRYSETTRRDEDGNILPDPTIAEAYDENGILGAVGEGYRDYKENVGADTLGEAVRRHWNLFWGDNIDRAQSPQMWAEAVDIPNTQYTFGEVTSAFLGAITNPDEVEFGTSPLQQMAEGFVNNLNDIYENAHGGKDKEDMTPEERENVDWAALNGYSGKEAQAATYEMLSQRDDVVEQMMEASKKLYASGDATTAALVGAEARRLATMTEREIIEENFDVWREIGPQILLDPLNLADVAIGALKLGPAARRAAKAVGEVMGVTELEVAEAAGELATHIYNGATTATKGNRAVRGVKGVTGYTAESRAAMDTGNSWMGVMRMFGGIEDKAQAQRLWKAMIENPETLPEVLDDMAKGSKVLGDRRTFEALKNTLPQIADDIASGELKMASLEGSGAFDIRKFASELHEGLTGASKKYWQISDDGKILGALPNLMRSIMSEQFLNTSIGHLVKNGLSAIGHLTTDGQMSLKRMDDIIADLSGKLGELPIVRVNEAYGGISDATKASTTGASSLYGGPSKLHKGVRKYVPLIGPTLIDANDVPRWAGSGFFGEQNFYTRGFYSRFNQALTETWGDTVATQLTSQLVQQGVPQQTAQAVASMVAAQGVKGNKKSIINAVNNYVLGNTNAHTLQAMGLQGNEFVDPKTYMSVSNVLDNMANGRVGLDEAMQQVTDIYSAERVRVADLLNAAGGTDPARAVSSVTDDAMDAAEATRNYRAANRRGTRDLADVKNFQEFMNQGQTEVREGLQTAMQNAGDMTTEKRGVFMEAWDEIDNLKTDARAKQNKAYTAAKKRADEAGTQAEKEAAWTDYNKYMRQVYDEMFQQQKSIVSDLPVRMAEVPVGYTGNSRSAIDLLAEISKVNEADLLNQMGSSDAQKVINARRSYVDYYENDLWATAQRLGVNDVNIDILASAQRDVEQAALKAVGDANEFREAAKRGEMTWEEAYKEMGKVWYQWGQETKVRFEAGKADMWRAAGGADVINPNRPTPTPDEIRALAGDAGISQTHGDKWLLNFANKHLDGSFKSLDEMDEADMLALEGKLEQRARRTAAGIMDEDEWISPAYGDATEDIMFESAPAAERSVGDVNSELRSLEDEARDLASVSPDSPDYDSAQARLGEINNRVNELAGEPTAAPVRDLSSINVGTEVITDGGERLKVKQILDESDMTTYVATRPDGTEVMLRPNDIAGYRGVRDLTPDDIGPITKIDGKYYTVNEGDDIVEVYNSSTKARMAAGNTVSPTISDALQVQYQHLTAAQQRTLNAMQQAMTSPQGQAMQRSLRQTILNTVNGMMGAYDDALFAAVRAGEAGADFSMLNYAARRGFDNVLASVVPFHYWYTRSAKNWLERMAAHPGLMAAYTKASSGNETYKEQQGVPDRYEGQVRVGNTNYYTREPWQYFFPIDDIFHANNFDNPDEATGWASRSLATAGVFGFGTFPLIDMGVAAAEGDWDRFTDGARNALWPYPAVADAYKMVTGEELIPALEDSFDPYREGRTFAALAAAKGTEYASTVAEYADQMVANRTNGVDPFTNIPAHMQDDVQAMYDEGRREEGRQSLVRSASRLAGFNTAYFDPNEREAAQASEDWRNMGYSYENQSGSQAARDQQLEDKPYVQPWWRKKDLLPDNIAEANPGQRAQTNQYWDEYGQISDREMRDLSEAVRSNPSMTPSEIREFRAPYWAEKEALDAKYPDRLESSDARYQATGTKDRRRGGENPIEEMTQVVIDVLAYKPPMGKGEDYSDEFGWPPKYPEQAEGEDPAKYKEKQQRYYFQKELYEQAREEHATRVLDQMATEEAGGSPTASDMFADQYLLGQYVPELLRGYDARFDSPELIAVEEQWDLQGEMKGADYERWEAEKQQRLARVADEVSVEAAQAMDAYSDLPKTGTERAEFRQAHPEIYEAWDVAYDPEEHANIKATFGDDIYDLAASYTPKSRDPEGYAKWKESHTPEEFQRVMSYFGYNREKAEQRNADPNADQSTQEGFTPAPNWMDVAGTQGDIRNQGAEPLGGMERQEYLYGEQAFNPYLGYTDYSPPKETRGGPSYAEYDNTSFGSAPFMPGGNQYNAVPGYNALPAITPKERIDAAGGEEALPEGFMDEVMAAAYAGENPQASGGAPAAAAAGGGGGGGYGGGGGGGGGWGGGGGNYQQPLDYYQQRLLAWRMDPWRLYMPNAQGRYGTQALGPQNVQPLRRS